MSNLCQLINAKAERLFRIIHNIQEFWRYATSLLALFVKFAGVTLVCA